MAHPKRKISKTRRDKRRTHIKMDIPNIVACANCGTSKLMHHVCPDCGHYRGQLAIEKDVQV